MGASTHAILQRRGKSGTWYTILGDVLTLGSSDSREFLQALPTHARGIPKDLQTFVEDGIDYHVWVDNDPYWLGEYGFHTLSLTDFCDMDSEENSGFSVYQDDGGLVIHVGKNAEWDFSNRLHSLQNAFRMMFFNLDEYRLVIGFDS